MAEKSINEMPRELRMLWTKGFEALQRENFDYAADLFSQVLAKEPGLYEVRKALRTAQAHKTGTGGGFFKKAFSNVGSSPLVAKGEMALRKDPAEALAVAEQILNSDANHSGAHRLVVKGATALDMPRTAALSLEVLNRNAPKDKEVAIEFANTLAQIGDVGRGEQILADLSGDYPADQELSQALKDLSARKTLDEGGYEALAGGGGSYRDILKDKEQAVSMEQANRVEKSGEVTDRLIAEYEARMVNEPKNLKLLRSLAELYREKKQFDTALGYYNRLKGTDLGNDASLDRAIADTTVRKFDHEISALDATAPEYPDKLAALQAERQAFSLSECQKRVERFPTDLGFRFELGQLYFQAGKIGEAIQELQKAQGNPHKRLAAKNYLAQCFAKRKMFDLAARTLQDALKEKPVFDEEKKDLIYNLGCVFESMGKKEDAVEQFKLIYEVDIGYKDVAAKVDKFYSGN